MIHSQCGKLLALRYLSLSDRDRMALKKRLSVEEFIAIRDCAAGAPALLVDSVRKVGLIDKPISSLFAESELGTKPAILEVVEFNEERTSKVPSKLISAAKMLCSRDGGHA